MNGSEKRRVLPLRGCSGNGSSPEGEPSRSVVDKCKGMQAHSQVLRIREEDSHLGEDIGEGSLSLKDKFGAAQFMLFSKPTLPASPLGGNTGH